MKNPIIYSDNLHTFEKFITKRAQAYAHKVNLTIPPPKDTIILTNRFTNISRRMDRLTKYIYNINKDTCDHSRNQLLIVQQVVLNRLISSEHTLILAHPIQPSSDHTPETFHKFYPSNVHATLNSPSKTFDDIIWSNAFYTSGTKTAVNKLLQQPYEPWMFAWWLSDRCNDWQNIHQHILNKDAHSVLQSLKKVYGIGNFMAYQIYLDLVYLYPAHLDPIPYYTPLIFSPDYYDDVNEGENIVSPIILGPGCKKGLAELDITFSDGRKVPKEMQVWYLTQFLNTESAYTHTILNYLNTTPQPPHPSIPDPPQIPITRLTIADVENCLCEFSKYKRLCRGEKMKRRRYDTFTNS